MTNMENKFNSQICTTRLQSEKLLALGLKKETADMRYAEYYIGDNCDGPYTQYQLDVCPPLLDQDIPAWSLHRLIEMIGDPFEIQHWLGFNIEKDYDHTIDCIEWLIEDNRFNEEYLV